MQSGGEEPAERRSGARRRRYDTSYASFLAEASRLLADSLDYETTLGTVAMLALPHLGAWCIVDVVEEDGDIRRVAMAHPDPRKAGAGPGAARRLAAVREDPLGVPAVARTRRPEVISRVDDELLRSWRAARRTWAPPRAGDRLHHDRAASGPGRSPGRHDVRGARRRPPVQDADLELAEDLATGPPSPSTTPGSTGRRSGPGRRPSVRARPRASSWAS
jgi:hypothetical protein